LALRAVSPTLNRYRANAPKGQQESAQGFNLVSTLGTLKINVASHVASTLASARAYEEERKRAEALAEIDRAKTTFFSNVSHEFRTPLTLILGPLEEILSDPKASPSVKERLEVAHRNSLRLLKLVNSLLDFSRIEASPRPSRGRQCRHA
jgi:signal transduction histidine kinase